MEKTLQSIGANTARHHLFLCLGPDCCGLEHGEVSWEFLKRRIKELGIPAMRSKTGCLRICARGPILLVYPEGIWYDYATPERLERILHEHLIGNRPVREWIFHQHRLE